MVTHLFRTRVLNPGSTTPSVRTSSSRPCSVQNDRHRLLRQPGCRGEKNWPRLPNNTASAPHRASSHTCLISFRWAPRPLVPIILRTTSRHSISISMRQTTRASIRLINVTAASARQAVPSLTASTNSNGSKEHLGVTAYSGGYHWVPRLRPFYPLYGVTVLRTRRQTHSPARTPSVPRSPLQAVQPPDAIPPPRGHHSPPADP